MNQREMDKEARLAQYVCTTMPCPKSEDGHHEIDFGACGAIVNEGSRWIIDVWCLHCGRSGSFPVDETISVNW